MLPGSCASNHSPWSLRFFYGFVTSPASCLFWLRCVRPFLASMELLTLSFDPRKQFQHLVWSRFGVHVTHSILDRASFSLVAAFGRCKFRLTPETVGTLLQVAIGGVVNLRSFSCDAFKVFFFLWGNEGPNWRFEFKQYLHEEASAWVSSSSKTNGLSYAQVVKLTGFFGDNIALDSSSRPGSSVLLTGANAIPLGAAMDAGTILSGANAVPLGNPAVHALAFNKTFASSSSMGAPASSAHDPNASATLTGANTVPLGPNQFSFMAGTKRSAHDRLIFPRTAASPLLESTHVAQTRRCSRCLSSSHCRVNCRQPIKCTACLKSGHVVASCFIFKSLGRQQYPHNANHARAAAASANLGSKANAQPPLLGPRISHRERARAFWRHMGSTLSAFNEQDFSRQLRPNPNSIQHEDALYAQLDPSGWSLSGASSSWSAFTRGATVAGGENPTTFHNSTSPASTILDDTMAFQHVDPGPFIPDHLSMKIFPIGSSWRARWLRYALLRDMRISQLSPSILCLVIR